LAGCVDPGGRPDRRAGRWVQAGRAAHRADARKVKAFIRSFGILGKTDAIDAKALARYGEERHATLPRWQPRDAARDRLQTLVLTRSDLVTQRVACANRLAAPGAGPVRRHPEAVLHCLDAQIVAIAADTEALLRASVPLASAARTVRGIAGIGPSPPSPCSPSCPSSAAAKPPPSPASRRTPIRAAPPMPIAAPEAADPR